MTDVNRFRLLGPVEILIDGVEARFERRQHRDLLVLLLLHLNRPLAVERIVADMWGPDPPATARAQVSNMVSAVRRSLVGGGDPVATLAHRHGGYVLEAAPDLVDAAEFETLAARARSAATAGESADLLRAAVGLWRGEPLGGVQAAFAAPVRVAWEERRLSALEDLYEAELALGRHAHLVPQLTADVADHPYRERLLGQLMLALYRGGRQAEALGAFRDARKLLADEHGLEPSAGLRTLEGRILRADPTLQVRPEAPEEADPVGAVPRQLPAAVRHFVGRHAEVKDLTRLADEAGVGAAVVVAVIAGTGGVGKTTLAVHWAHGVADRFPDGQLHVNLRGFDPSASPTSPAEAIRSILDALDVAPSRVPAGLDAQAALYRSIVAGRRILLVLDNARDAEQVRPLLPGAGGAMVVVTSRNRLTGLVAEGAHSVGLGLLTAAEAHDLLTRHLGPERVAAEPDAVRRLVAHCAHLPLSLAIVAARAAVAPAFALSAFADQLADAGERLDALDTSDPSTRPRAVFSWSYQQLGAEAARLFRLLGLHPGPDVSTAAAASLAGRPVAETRRALTELADVHMLTEHVPDRHAFHDLLRAYAAERAHLDDSDDDRSAATHRLLDHYLHTAWAAARGVQPNRDMIRVAPPVAGSTPEPLGHFDAAMAWFTAEHRVLVAAVKQADATGWDVHACQLAWTLANYLDLRGHWHDWIATHLAGLAAARRTADLGAMSRAELLLGRAYMRVERYDDAYAHASRSLDLARQNGDENGQAHSEVELAALRAQQGRFTEALEHARRALDLYPASRGQSRANVLNNIGWYHGNLGDYEEALVWGRRALPIHQEVGDRLGEAENWDTLGYAHHHLGHHAEALDCYRHALDLQVAIGHRLGQAATLVHMGEVHLAAGEPAGARVAWREAFAIMDDLEHADAAEVRAKLAALDRSEAGRR